MEVTGPPRKICRDSDEELANRPFKEYKQNQAPAIHHHQCSSQSMSGAIFAEPSMFLCSASEHFPTAYHVLKAVEEKFGLLFEVKPTLSDQFLEKPRDDESLQVLSSIKEIDGKPLHIVLKEASWLQKSVVCGFPQEFGLCLLSRLDNVCSPMRMKSRAGVETKQVSVFFKGEIPEFTDLASWGCYAFRPFVLEPLRCYRCQRWGHHQLRCTLRARCGVCSGAHNTTHCLSLHKRKEKTPACCPNCGGKHHAWNLSCPPRKAQISRMHNHQQAKHPKQSSKKEETNQGKKGKQLIRKKK